MKISTVFSFLSFMLSPCLAHPDFDEAEFGPPVDHTPLKPRTVLITFESKPGEEDALKSLLQKAVAMSAFPPGANLEYRLHQSTDNPRVFFLYERWRNEEVRAERSQKPSMKQVQEQVREICAKPYEVTFAEEIAPK